MTRLGWKGWLIVLFAIVLLSYAREIPELVMAYSAKTGRVVDAVTRKGIPDVAVIASGYFFSGGLYQTQHGCTYNVIGYTDSEGKYWLPGTWRHISPGLPYLDPHNTWSITAVKPGYVFAGDKERIEKNANANLRSLRGAAADSVSSSWMGYVVSVSDIALETADLSLRQKTEYFPQTGGCVEDNSELSFRLRRDLFDNLKNGVCGADSSTQLDSETVLGLQGFSIYLSHDSRAVFRFTERLSKLDPAFADILKSEHQEHTYRAADVCQVMTDMGREL